MSPSDELSLDEATRRRSVWRLGILFGLLYFIQGIGEPGTGLMEQPVRSLLESRGLEASLIGGFSATLGLPWAFKPIYGLLTDFVPLFGSRRRSWLIVSSAATVGGFSCLAIVPSLQQSYYPLLACLVVANLGVAFSDVVVDALMIETGQPLGATGRFQSIQWASMMTAGALAGVFGGWISQHQQQGFGFALCAGATLVTLACSLFVVREPGSGIPRQSVRSVLAALWRTARSRTILVAVAFLFLWSFNPFSVDVLYLHLRRIHRFDDQTIGYLKSTQAVAAVLATVSYGFYCTRVRFTLLLHLSIALGVLSTLAYWLLQGKTSAFVIEAAVGFTYYTATMIQLDLAARICPPQVAGTIFALLMSVSNLGVSLAVGLGGVWYERWSARWNPTTAFHLLVATGAAFTAACWLLTPWLTRASASAAQAHGTSIDSTAE